MSRIKSRLNFACWQYLSLKIILIELLINFNTFNKDKENATTISQSKLYVNAFLFTSSVQNSSRKAIRFWNSLTRSLVVLDMWDDLNFDNDSSLVKLQWLKNCNAARKNEIWSWNKYYEIASHCSLLNVIVRAERCDCKILSIYSNRLLLTIFRKIKNALFTASSTLEMTESLRWSHFWHS